MNSRQSLIIVVSYDAILFAVSGGGCDAQASWVDECEASTIFYYFEC